MTKRSISVVFCAEEVGHFTHVYVIDGVQEIDMTYGRLTVDIGHRAIGRDWVVLEAEIAPNTAKNRIWWPIMPISCVSFTKRLLGINKPFVLTSKQLYNYLKE